LDDGDLTYITAILNSFSKPKLTCEQTPFSPEGALTRAPIQTMTPPKFNQNFNQNLTSYDSEDKDFSCFSNFEEEGTTKLEDYFSDEEDDNLDNEDLSSENDSWSQSDFEELQEISDRGHTWRKFEANKSRLETIHEVNYEEPGEQNRIKGISSLSEEIALAF
jgi:hypothetical protein